MAPPPPWFGALQKIPTVDDTPRVVYKTYAFASPRVSLHDKRFVLPNEQRYPLADLAAASRFNRVASNGAGADYHFHVSR